MEPKERVMRRYLSVRPLNLPPLPREDIEYCTKDNFRISLWALKIWCILLCAVGSDILRPFWDYLPWKTDPIGCTETSVRDYCYWLRNKSEGCSYNKASGLKNFVTSILVRTW